jgi:putative DNA primase/helicase
MTRHLTLDRAQGRWREILPLFGIDTRFLRNKHGPCPLCGGRDRYRFDDKAGNGTFYCNHCGAGNGLTLIMQLKGWDFRTAACEVDKIIGDRPREKTKAIHYTADPAWRLKEIERVIAAADQPEIVSSYLSRRGLAVSSPVLCGHPRLLYVDDDNQLIGRFPAVVAPIAGPDGDLRSALRIYDADIKPRKKTMATVSTINGAAIRLHHIIDGEIGIAEGVETALAAFQLFNVPVWSVISANGIKTFCPPAGTRRLVVFADNDRNYVGQAAAYQAAERLTRQGIEVEIRVAPEVDTDWLDALVAGPR